MWFWLARIIRGRSQHDRIRRGVDKGSVAISGFIRDQPVSEAWNSQWRLIKAIMSPWVRDEGHSHFGGVSQIVGNSISVGRRIFSIVRGLGFVGGQCRVFGLLLREGPGRRWPHMQRKLGEA